MQCLALGPASVTELCESFRSQKCLGVGTSVCKDSPAKSDGVFALCVSLDLLSRIKPHSFHLPCNDVALREVLNCTVCFPLGDEILQTTS